MCVHMYVDMAGQACVYMQGCMYVYVFVCMYIYMYIYVYIYIYVCIYVYICMWMYVYMYLCARVCMRVYIYMRMDVCIREVVCRSCSLSLVLSLLFHSLSFFLSLLYEDLVFNVRLSTYYLGLFLYLVWCLAPLSSSQPWSIWSQMIFFESDRLLTTREQEDMPYVH